MGATFSRVKTWVAEKLTAADLNAEINNILNNLSAAGVDDYSSNVAEMQIQTDPGEVGTESLAQSTAQELARLRYAIAELKGTVYWYTSPVTTLSALNTAFGNGGLPSSRLTSGETTGNSNQSYLLTAEGAGNGNNVVINGTAVDLVYYVDNTEYTLDADVTIASTSAAPSTNNTALVNDTGLGDQQWTKWTGMYGGGIPIDSIGSEITSLNGKLAAFRLTTGAGDEYFLATPDTTNNQLKDVKRGWFFDENGSPVKSIVFADNDTITLMKIAWIFLVNDNTASVTYTEPVVSATEPGSPTNGDYWYDLANGTWKIFNGVSFGASNAVFIGISIQDENGDCVATRSEDYVKTYISGNTTEIEFASNSTVQCNKGARVGVNGTTLALRNDELVWDMASNLATGLTEAASTMYFFYIKESGAPVIDIIAPDDFINSRGGFYHPHETWRCVGQAWNNASSNLEKVISYHSDDASLSQAASSVATNALTLEYWASPLAKYKLYDTNGANKEVHFPIYQSITVPSGATLGHYDNSATTGFYTIDNVVLHLVTNNNYTTLGVSSHQHGQGHLRDTIAISTSADTGALYTGDAYTAANVKAIAVGQTGQTTAGTWAANLDYFKASSTINVCRRVTSGDSGTFSTTATSSTLVTNTAIDLFITGSRNYRIYVEPTQTGSGHFGFNTTTSTSCGGALTFYIDGTAVKGHQMFLQIGTSGTPFLIVPCHAAGGLIKKIEIEAVTGINAISTFDLRIRNNAINSTASATRLRLVVEELPYEGDS